MEYKKLLALAAIVTVASSTIVQASEIVVRASKELQSLPEGSNSVEIDGQSFSGRFITAGDITERVSGVYTSRSNSLEQKEGISIRGFSGNQVKVLIDGIPLSEKGGNSIDLSRIPAEIIDKIIVSKGPISGIYGSGAMGGIVNVITKKKLKQSKLSYLGGSFDTQNISGQVFQDFKLLRLSLVGFSNSTSGNYKFKNQKFDPLYDNNQKKTLSIENNQSHELGGKVNFSSNKKKMPVNVGIEFHQKTNGIPGRTTQGFQNISESNRQIRSQATLSSYKIGRNLLTANIYHRNTQREYEDPLGERNGFSENFITKTDGYGMSGELLSPFSPKISQKFITSTDYENFNNNEIDISRSLFKITSMTDFVFFDESLSITPYFSFVSATALESQLPAGLSISYNFTNNLASKINLSKGFRYPTFDELYLNRGMFVGNSELKPENSLGGDIGLEYKTRKWRFQISYFLYETTDQIEYLLVSGFQYKPFNFRKTLTEGIEIGSKARTWSFLSFDTSLTFQNVLNRDQDNDFYNRFVPNKPRIYGVQKVEVLSTYKFKVFSELIIAFDRFANRSNSKRVTDRFLTNLGFQYSVTEKALASLEVQNIFDEYNLDIRGFPLPERSFYASASYSF